MYKNQRHFENVKQHEDDMKDERLAKSILWAFVAMIIICLLVNLI